MAMNQVLAPVKCHRFLKVGRSVMKCYTNNLIFCEALCNVIVKSTVLRSGKRGNITFVLCLKKIIRGSKFRGMHMSAKPRGWLRTASAVRH